MKTIEIEDFAYHLLMDGAKQLETSPAGIASIAILTYYKILALPEEEAAAILETISNYRPTKVIPP